MEKDAKGKIIRFVLVSSVLGMLAWGLLYLGLRPYTSSFNTSVVATFVAFLFIPVLLLTITGRKLELGNRDHGLLISIIGYQFFALWLISYYWVNPDYYKEYEIFSGDHLLYLALVAFYVPPVDFFTRRVVHLEIERGFGKKMGLIVGTVAWMVGHSWEVIWLSELTGVVSSFLFILVSGVVTGLLYLRYKNVLGLMVGHWMVNLMITVVTSILST